MMFRAAEEKDLPSLQAMYIRIVEHMHSSGLHIWDDMYPCCALSGDVDCNRLDLLSEDDEPIAALALCEQSLGEKEVEWENPDSRAIYIDRLGVDPGFAKRGFGSLMLSKAQELAKSCGAEYLRLFAVDSNIPAISLYLKSGFTQVNGIYVEKIDDELSMLEFGFEKKL